MRKYHKTEERKSFYQQQAQAQNYKCIICTRSERLVVDHDHITGFMRGVICYGCNAGLGMFLDNPDILIRAAKYLKDFEVTKPNQPKKYRNPKQEKQQEVANKILELLNNSNFVSDRARARELSRHFPINYTAAQARVARMRRKIGDVGGTCGRNASCFRINNLE